MINRLCFWLPIGSIAFLSASLSAEPPRIADYMHNNPGEALTVSAFTDPQHLARRGYNVQVLDNMRAAMTFDSFDPEVLPKGSEIRNWIEAKGKFLDQQLKAAKDAGLRTMAFMELIVLPKPLVDKYHDELCDEKNRISIHKPMTQKVVRAQIKEIFDRYPNLDGLVIRTGEVYLFDAPYHVASGTKSGEKLNESTAIINGPDSHIELLKILRDEACVKRNKVIYYRTWDFGNNFHVNTEYYQKVTDAIEPHPNLYFSIKHQKGDFHRFTVFNPTLMLGKHRQIVEVQCQHEGYGKEAHPYYAARGIVEGWEEYSKIMEPGQPKGLKDIVKNPLFAGVTTWTRGGGWRGPYITDEMWCELNGYVVTHYVADPSRGEEEIFNEYATQVLGISKDDLPKFRELCLLSDRAVLLGQLSYFGTLDVWWARDDTFKAPKFDDFIKSGTVRDALKEKAEAVAMWKRIEELSKQIKLSDPKRQEYMQVSCTYGRFKYAVVEQMWTILMLGQQGDKTKKYDKETIAKAIAEYDRLWVEWKNFKEQNALCPTLPRPVAMDYKTMSEVPGVGAAIDKYRAIVGK